ncbi:class I SAM-dependent methyltransferase [Parasphingorhabdus halotolerans]|uniref:Class I SAM-dependent methyltransferase n=1 Tax=Parasphingorhabdus halotolerans TaxID=2725558 RepID=A0A6H2DIM8_9SPHN|nr:class I SAM-dependent methyltransferase [Parasphingorhabdus halotolerans]QJB68529.1 class I SAM-dependent methyltransferase [Parasphingorhabdus halotolerans]
MPIGPIVRQMFGPFEHHIAALYRAIFVDIGAYADRIAQWVPGASNILEVGCGEGAVTEHLAKIYPKAQITAIDITPRVGRLYRGDRSNVAFEETTVQEVAASRPHQFDFIILSDVIHHVPEALRSEILDSVRTALAPNGTFIFKDWKHSRTPIHWMCHAGDRWLTGDKVRYLDKKEADAMIGKSFPDAKVADEAWVRPWRNNFAMLIKA